MTCTTVVQEGVLATVCAPRLRVVREEPAGVRWCFGCRAHLPHVHVVLDEDEPSYYEPVHETRCTRCGKDRTQFPGAGSWY